jgi:uncharacterized protein YidB (DUF937 family)
MGMLDALAKNPQMIGDIAKFAENNPQIAKAAMSLLSSEGGRSGLGGVLSSLQSNGLGEIVSSWLSTGANKPVSAEQVHAALGPDRVQQFAKQAGMSGGEASATLASLLPSLVDKLSPDGKLPDAQGVESLIGRVLGAR